MKSKYNGLIIENTIPNQLYLQKTTKPTTNFDPKPQNEIINDASKPIQNLSSQTIYISIRPTWNYFHVTELGEQC